ncbi:hypothetical protein EOM39_04465 [Candidatus Gracilibacteria bacterium]|nr:hypothetical protein [Candidatus Gracilibacteria bacterium]
MIYPNHVKRKALYRKSNKALDCLNLIRFYNGGSDLQFENQDMDTKRHLYSAIDELKKFIDNII